MRRSTRRGSNRTGLRPGAPRSTRSRMNHDEVKNSEDEQLRVFDSGIDIDAPAVGDAAQSGQSSPGMGNGSLSRQAQTPPELGTIPRNTLPPGSLNDRSPVFSSSPSDGVSIILPKRRTTVLPSIREPNVTDTTASRDGLVKSMVKNISTLSTVSNRPALAWKQLTKLSQSTIARVQMLIEAINSQQISVNWIVVIAGLMKEILECWSTELTDEDDTPLPK